MRKTSMLVGLCRVVFENGQWAVKTGGAVTYRSTLRAAVYEARSQSRYITSRLNF